MHDLVAIADGDAGSLDERSRSGYIPTSPAMSESHSEETPVLPLELRRPPLPPFSPAQGNMELFGPSPFSYDPSPNIAVQNVDARQIHQQALFVNQDKSAEVMEIAELKRWALMAEQGRQFASEAMQFRDTVANEAKTFVAESSEHQAAITQQGLNDMSNVHNARQALERQSYLDQMALARQREDALRSELATVQRPAGPPTDRNPYLSGDSFGHKATFGHV